MCEVCVIPGVRNYRTDSISADDTFPLRFPCRSVTLVHVSGHVGEVNRSTPKVRVGGPVQQSSSRAHSRRATSAGGRKACAFPEGR